MSNSWRFNTDNRDNNNNPNQRNNNNSHNSNRQNMYMFNPQNCPWQGQGQQMYNRIGNQGNGQMFQNVPPFQGQPRPPIPYHYNMMPPYQPGPNWQGPGPSRPRNRGYRLYRGSSHHRGNRSNHRDDQELDKENCCKCGERLQNCNEPGVHLCDGGNEVQLDEDQDAHSEQNKQASAAETHEEELDARLEKLLGNLKDFLRNKYQTVTEALEEYVSGKIEEINTLHRGNTAEKATLQKLKAAIEEKANILMKQEKELREKQRRLVKDQELFNHDMKKEKEEVCRQWQQLRDEIVRMEEMHETQKGRIKLDVGGNVFTTSLLTLTRESDSMLAAMFSGRHELQKQEDGCVFIDRDGTHFRYVLNYLRDGGVNMECLPRDRQLLKELRKEATYYQLHGLLQQLEKCL